MVTEINPDETVAYSEEISVSGQRVISLFQNIRHSLPELLNARRNNNSLLGEQCPDLINQCSTLFHHELPDTTQCFDILLLNRFDRDTMNLRAAGRFTNSQRIIGIIFLIFTECLVLSREQRTQYQVKDDTVCN